MSLYSYQLIIEKYHDQILKIIESNKVVIIKGPTGCGKSTYVPFLLKDKKVAIIEPRRIAVTSLYNILSQKIENVGYKMRFNNNIKTTTTMKIFTDGSFLNTIEDAEYDYIIVDEVHERSLRTDLILMLLKMNLKSKLILMSATLDTSKLEKYFKAVTFEVPGSSYPVDIKYLDEPTNDYVTECFLTVKNILKNRNKDEKKDILVFLPGEEDINDCYKVLKKIPSIKIYKVHSTMNDSDQMKIFESSELTKVILATNVCETSITIPNIKYVIDTGLCKNKIYSEISYLGIQKISKESSIQRMGRCNRIGPGVCYKLYKSSEQFNFNIPEIQRSDLTWFILFLINLRKNILEIQFIDYPSVKNIILSLEFLLLKKCIIGFYKNEKFDLLKDLNEKIRKNNENMISRDIYFKVTNYGRKLARYSFNIDIAHFYEQCVQNNLGYYGGIIAAMVSQDNYNFLVASQEKKTDLQVLINIYEEFEKADNKIEFCKKKRVPYKGMENTSKITSLLNKSKNGNLDKLNRIFSNCFNHNICIRQKDGSYILEKRGSVVYIHPSSAFFKRNDKKIVLVDIFCSTKPYGRIIGKYYD